MLNTEDTTVETNMVPILIKLQFYCERQMLNIQLHLWAVLHMALSIRNKKLDHVVWGELPWESCISSTVKDEANYLHEEEQMKWMVQAKSTQYRHDEGMGTFKELKKQHRNSKKAIWDTEMVSPKILVPLSHFLISQTSSSKNINIKAY